MTFKSGFYPGEGQFSVPNPVRQKVLSKFTHTFEKGKPLVGKGTIRVCLALILVDWDHFSLKEPIAAFDFKPCKLYCKTEIITECEGKWFCY